MGGKGDNLVNIQKSIIERKEPDIEIPPFFRIPGNLSHEEALSLARDAVEEIGYPLMVRSDGPEDEMGQTYAGLFITDSAKNEDSLVGRLDLVRNSYTSPDIARYAESRGIEPPDSPIDVILQRDVHPRMRAIITRHPHWKGKFHVDVNIEPYLPISPGRFPKHFNMVADMDSIDEVVKECSNWMSAHVASGEGTVKIEPDPTELDPIREGILQGFEDFKKIETLYDPRIAYQMEIGVAPYAVFQWRPFRFREESTFNFEDDSYDEDVYKLPFVLGVTPPEGIILHLIGLPSSKPSMMTGYYEMEREDVDSENLAVITGPMDPAADRLDRANIVPALTIFQGGENYAWQSHDCFRFLERGTLVAMVDYFTDFSIVGSTVNYRSNGVEGRLRVLER